MLRTPNMPASCCSLSQSIFASLNAPAYSPASFSRIGPSVLQGPHQVAQKSTSTGVVSEACNTSISKLAWPASKTCEGFVESVCVALGEEFMGIRSVKKQRHPGASRDPAPHPRLLQKSPGSGLRRNDEHYKWRPAGSVQGAITTGLPFFLYTVPAFITKSIFFISAMSSSGLPGTATRSAYLPGVTLPRSLSCFNSSAACMVAAWMVNIGGMPACTM